MAITETRNLPAPFIQSLGEYYGKQLPAQQAQAQAVGDVGREGKRMAAYEPYERLGFLGQGLTGIMGGYGNQYQFQSQPNPTPLQTALGTGATLAGIYGAVRGAQGGGGWQGGQIYNPPAGGGYRPV